MKLQLDYQNTERWMAEIAELEDYFSEIILPARPIKLNPNSTITDCRLFVKTHLATIKKHIGNPVFSSYLDRLKEFRSVLINSNQSKL